MYCFHLSNWAFGDKNGSWVLSFIGLVEGSSIACLEVGLQRGFARETLGEPSTFELWQTGHNIHQPLVYITPPQQTYAYCRRAFPFQRSATLSKRSAHLMYLNQSLLYYRIHF